MTGQPFPDRLILPAMQAVKRCMVAQLAIIDRPVCHAVLYFADHYPPAQGCDCRCDEPQGGEGVAWVRMVQAQATNSQGTSPCPSGEMQYQLEAGVYRCAPTLDSSGNPIVEDKLEGWPEGMMTDLAALRRAFTCCTWLIEQRDVRPQISAMNPIGPSGGCVGAAVRANITDLDCGCPEGVVT